jgi:hypothetical protein
LGDVALVGPSDDGFFVIEVFLDLASSFETTSSSILLDRRGIDLGSGDLGRSLSDSAGITKVRKGEGAVEYVVGMGPSMRLARGEAPLREVGLGGVESRVEVTGTGFGSAGLGVVIDLTGS